MLHLVYLILALALLMGKGASADCPWPERCGDGDGDPIINIPTDTDNDGNPDIVVVSGDFNGDGSVCLDDVALACDTLRAEAGRKICEIRAGTYDMSCFADLAAWRADPALSSLIINTVQAHDRMAIIMVDEMTLRCAPGVKLLGFTDPDDVNDQPNGFTIVGNGGVLDFLEDANGIIEGCTIHSGLAYGPDGILGTGDEPYDGRLTTDGGPWTSDNHFAVRLSNLRNWIIRNNEIGGGPHHSCLYMRDSIDAHVHDNTMSSCASFEGDEGTIDDTIDGALVEGDILVAVQSGETSDYVANDHVKILLDNGTWHHADVRAVNGPGDTPANTLELYPATAIPSPAADNNEIFAIGPSAGGSGAGTGIYFFDTMDITTGNVVEDNVLNDLGGGGLWTRADDVGDRVRNQVWKNNVLTDVANVCGRFRSCTKCAAIGNICNNTEGWSFTNDASAFCSESDTDPDCTENLVFRNNVLNGVRVIHGGIGTAIRFQNYTEAVLILNNTVTEVRNNSCIIITPTSAEATPRNIRIIGNSFNFCDEQLIEVGTSSDPVPSGLVFRGNVSKHIGMEKTSWENGNKSIISIASLTNMPDGWIIRDNSFLSQNGIAFNLDASLTNWDIVNNIIDGTFAGFLGRYTEAGFAAVTSSTCDAGIEGRWVIITDANDDADCDFTTGGGGSTVACACHSNETTAGPIRDSYAWVVAGQSGGSTTIGGLPACPGAGTGTFRRVSDTADEADCTVGGGGTSHLCVCDTGGWVDAQEFKPIEAIRIFGDAGETIQGLNIQNNQIVNWIEGIEIDEGGSIIDNVSIVGNVGKNTGIGWVWNAVDWIRCSDCNPNVTNLTIEGNICIDGVDGINECFDSFHDAADDDIWASNTDIHSNNDAPLGTCAGADGARWTNRGGAAGSIVYVCIDGAWAAVH